MSLQALAWSLEQHISPPTAKLLLIVLSQYADEKGQCAPSIDQLEMDCSVARGTVISASQKLADLGYISTEKRAGGASGGSETILYTIRKPENPIRKTRKTRKPLKKFQKPTAQEVESYGNSINFAINGQNFIDFYESKGWKVGNTPMRDWKAAVRTWKQRHKDEPRKQSFASNLFGRTGEVDLGEAGSTIWAQMDEAMGRSADDVFSSSGMDVGIKQISSGADQAGYPRLDGGMATDSAGSGRTLEAGPSSPEDVFFAQTKN